MFDGKLRVFGVVLLLVLAGCTGGGVSDGGDGGAAPATDTAAPDDGGSDAAGGDGGDSSGDGAAGDGAAGGDSAADDSLSLTDPKAALESAGSFTSAWRYSGVDEDGVEAAVSYAYRADLDTGKAYVTVSTEQDGEAMQGGFEMFSTDGITYTRFGSGDDVFYQAQPQETDDVVSQSLARSAIYGTDVDGLEKQGTETYDGVRVTRYELTRTDETLFAGAATAGTDHSELAELDVEYVVLVDGDGLVRYESWAFTGTTNDGTPVNGQWEYSLTGVGSTSVDDPDWLADAKAQTDN